MSEPILKTLTNIAGATVYNELKPNIRAGSKLSVISKSFTIYAYEALQKELDKIDSIRFIYSKPNFIPNEKQDSREYEIENNPTELFDNEFELELKNEMKQSAIAKDCYKWLEEKAEIKTFRNTNPAELRLIHSKNKKIDDVVVSGSVDFTTDGLGITPSTRTDINTFMTGEATNSHLAIFDSYWKNDDLLVDVKDDVLQQMTKLYKENQPEFIYYLSLYNIFNNSLNELNEDNIVRKGNNLKESKIWNKLYKFQKDAAIGAISKIEKYNGCILADSVGLGKTFTALAVIKYYESRNDRVLVLAPKKLRENWTIYKQNDKRNIFDEDRLRYDVLNHTDLSRETGKSGDMDLKTINWGNYDLVVIDESHNFRNNPKRNDRVTRYEKLMNEIIKSGHKTKLLMLSATPVNNRMTDIKNQIAFITEDNPYALTDYGIPNIEHTLRQAQGVFNQWSELPEDERTGAEFINRMNLDYFTLLDALTIARSRKHIEKYYTLDEIGQFPERLTPINKYSGIDLKEEFLSFEEVNTRISMLNLGIFAPTEFILPPKREDYAKKYDIQVQTGAHFHQSDRERSLVQLMRMNLLKRMESSIHAFKISLKKLLYNIQETLDKIENHEYVPELDINLLDIEENEFNEQMVGRNAKILLQDMDLIKWGEELRLDEEKLSSLLIVAQKITPDRDEKLDDLKNQIKEKIENPINQDNKKVLIFSAFADTAKYLYDNISKWALKEYGLHTGLVTGSGANKSTLESINVTDINEVLTNFSPKSKERHLIDPDADEEIDILIGTDCISEGQNLQDCDYLINYDIHWNPVRIIQRFGRIDRIGSENKEIQLVNFWPNMELEEYINLKGRVENRMVMVDVSATGEENIIDNTGRNAVNDLEYRKNQLEKLQEELLDLEDLTDNISITNLTFNDFKIDLMTYMKEHKEELQKAPHGIYSIVPATDEVEDIEPGVIFLLKQIKGFDQTQGNNPLFPYYLIYITDDGNVRFNHLQSKKSLDNYQKLCNGQTEIYNELVKKFEEATDDGRNMEKYSKLLANSLENIIGKKEEEGIDSLFTKGRSSVINKNIEVLEEFELITFLIIEGE